MLFGIECLADARMMDVCNGHNSMNLLVRFRGGASLYIIR